VAQWTSDRQVFQATVKLASDRFRVPETTITLADGRQFVGTIMGMDTGNDAGNYNPSIPQNYHGSVRLEAVDTVYMIDIVSIRSIV